jgi:hypothetical protein
MSAALSRHPSVMDSHAPHTIVVLPHTHWDREWYHPVGRMRQRLATLVDELLAHPDGLPFLLDGQTIVLDDYRALRPERAELLKDALRSGRIEAGPWFVLADQLLPGGEALVRNLLEGTRTIGELGGAAPAVLYSPDAFGHSAAGPVLAEGFGMPVAVLWRGYGGPDHPVGMVARWSHPSGARVLLYHLPPEGYEIGASLPTAPDAAAVRWRTMRAHLVGQNPLGVTLLPNGADHHARQTALPLAVNALAYAATPYEVVVDSLAGFAGRLLANANDTPLPSVKGELRDSSGWTWSLQGTFGTRAHQKRRNAEVERTVLRDAEPWVALAWFARGAMHHPSLRLAWRTLLETHPHDTLCGCSVDDVARAADVRWSDALSQAHGVRDDAIATLVDYDAESQRELEAYWQPTAIVRNPSARQRGGLVRLRLHDQVIPDPVGPGSASRSGARMAAPPGPPEWSGEEHVQILQRGRAFDRVESPRHYPRNAVVRTSDALAMIPPMAGYGVIPVTLAQLGSLVQPVPVRDRVRAGTGELVGPHWRVAVSPQGVTAVHAATGARVQPFGWLESATDAGDLYTPSIRSAPIIGHWGSQRVDARGPLAATWEVDTVIERPRQSVVSATEPLAREVQTRTVGEISCTASVSMFAATEWLEVNVRGDNQARDHRLRWVLPLPASIRTDRHIADAAFGPVDRTRSRRDPKAWSAEERLPTAPLHRWLLLQGDAYAIGVVSDGLAEYELTAEGHLAITLVRAVGELSRRDIPERPGHAGWPAPVPDAQAQGPFAARFAIAILPARRDDAIERVEAIADDVLLPLVAETWRGVGTVLSPVSGISLDGHGLTASAIKRSEDGQWLVLRCVNSRDAAVRGTWRLPRAAQEVRVSRLDETPGAALSGTGATIVFEAPARGVTTILVR